MTHTPLTVAAHRLDISLYTLRQWCQKAGIDLEQQKSLSDPRQKWVTDEQLQQLATSHGRLLDQEAEEQELIPVNAYRLLIEQIAQVVQQAEQIGVDHAALQTGSTELRRQHEDTSRLLVEIQQQSHERAEQHQQAILTLQKEQQQAYTALKETNARQQEHGQALEQHTAQIGELQDQAARLEAEMQSHAGHLGELATRIDNQNHELVQLVATINDLTKQMRTQAEQAQQAQARLREEAEQAKQRLRAEFQTALNALQKQMQSTLEGKARDLSAAIPTCGSLGPRARTWQARTSTFPPQPTAPTISLY